MIKIDKGLLRFSLIVGTLSLAYFVYFTLRYGQIAGPKSPWHEAGEFFGSVGAYALVGLYGRSLLKILLSPQNSPRWCQPLFAAEGIKKYGQRVVQFLNRTHYHLGIASIAILLLHAVMEGVGRFNPFLIMVLILLAWQGIFGMLILTKFLPPSLKRPAYPAHAQLFSGIMILIFAAFGHLLVD